MCRYLWILLWVCFSFKISAQQQVLQLKPEQIEALFLKQNLELVARQLAIPMADAVIEQARLWNNPSFSLDGVNLWSSAGQREGETIPPLFGNFARNTQFSAELSQMISVSGKRAKLVKMEQISREMAVVQFGLILKGLKTELRKTITGLVYLQDYQRALIRQQESLEKLIAASEKLHSRGNLSGNELIRLQSALLEMENEMKEVRVELNAARKNLKNLLSIREDLRIEVVPDQEPLPAPGAIDLTAIQGKAMEQRADLGLQKLQTEYYRQSLRYEKSLRIPDLNLSVGYDRRGGVWRDFVGFGIGLDIPVFNRNQGAIKAARLSQQQSELLVNQQEAVIFNEVAEAYANYTDVYALYERTVRTPVLSKLDEMLDVYTKNLMEKNISMVEYMDFMETYKNAKQAVLAAKRDVQLGLEELSYTIGTEIIGKP